MQCNPIELAAKMKTKKYFLAVMVISVLSTRN